MNQPTQPGKTCALHGLELLEGTARYRYDMFNGRREYFRDRGQFPNAQSFKLYGVGGRPKERRAQVFYCPKCRELERRWWAARKKWWQFWRWAWTAVDTDGRD